MNGYTQDKLTDICKRCGHIGPTQDTPCHACKGFHALCAACRDTYERFYFCESNKCFLNDPVLRKTV